MITFSPPELSANLSSVQKLCLYSNGNYLGEFDTMSQIEEYLKSQINPYAKDPKEQFNDGRYSVIPSQFIFLV